jgi:hypothetical protein
MPTCAVTAVSSLSPSESSSDQITIVPSWRHMASICSAYASYSVQMLGTALGGRYSTPIDFCYQTGCQ